METYLAALVSYYLKPRTRRWTPGQRESTILITAPKIVEETRKRDLSEEEATHRLSFLAEVVDSEGQSIKGVNNSIMRDDLAAEANMAEDMFETYHSESLNKAIKNDTAERHQDAIREMRDAIERASNLSMAGASVTGHSERTPEPVPSTVASINVKPEETPNPVIVTPGLPVEPPVEKPVENVPAKTPTQTPINNSIIELANNPDFSVATIAKEAKRIRKDDGEVFISLH
jgi:hypothetical protein